MHLLLVAFLHVRTRFCAGRLKPSARKCNQLPIAFWQRFAACYQEYSPLMLTSPCWLGSLVVWPTSSALGWVTQHGSRQTEIEAVLQALLQRVASGYDNEVVRKKGSWYLESHPATAKQAGGFSQLSNAFQDRTKPSNFARYPLFRESSSVSIGLPMDMCYAGFIGSPIIESASCLFQPGLRFAQSHAP